MYLGSHILILVIHATTQVLYDGYCLRHMGWQSYFVVFMAMGTKMLDKNTNNKARSFREIVANLPASSSVLSSNHVLC